MRSSQQAYGALPAPALRSERSDAGWVIWDGDGPSVAAVVEDLHPHVMRVAVNAGTNPVTSPRWDDLVTCALWFCRERDALKVVLSISGVPPALVRSLAASCGFHYSRASWANRVSVTEFYTDLYWTSGDTFNSRRHTGICR